MSWGVPLQQKLYHKRLFVDPLIPPPKKKAPKGKTAELISRLSMPKPERIRKKYDENSKEEPKIDPHNLPAAPKSILTLAEPKIRKPGEHHYTPEFPSNATYRMYMDKFNKTGIWPTFEEERDFGKPKK